MCIGLFEEDKMNRKKNKLNKKINNVRFTVRVAFLEKTHTIDRKKIKKQTESPQYTVTVHVCTHVCTRSYVCVCVCVCVHFTML